MFEHGDSKVSRIRRGVGYLVLGGLALVALGFVVLALWNGLLPGLLGLPRIHFCQALGLLVLSRILFGGWHRCHGHGGFRHRQRMIQHWESMSEEQKQKFRQGFRSGCCGSRKHEQA